MKLKRMVCTLLAAVMLIVAFPLAAFAADYPLILSTVESCTTIPEGEVGKLEFIIWPEFKNECYNVIVYNSDGDAVASVSETYYNTSSSPRDLTIDVDTDKLDLKTGTYTVEYWLDFYSLYSWHEIPNHYYDSFEIIENKCGGKHSFEEWYIISEPTLDENGKSRYNCKKCAHSVVKPLSAVKISKQPSSVTVTNGKTAKVSVTAKGDGLKYKWYFKDTNASKFSLTSSRSSTYSVEMNSKRSGRQVYCVITDKYDNKVQTKTVTLKVPNPLKITKQPTSAVVTKGKTAKVSVTAQGEGLKYAWYVKEPGKSTFVKSKLTSKTYSFTMSDKYSGRQVYCVVTNKYGETVKSKTAKLTQATPLKITKKPTSVAVFSGKTAKVSLTATGDGLKYKWYFKDKGSSKFSASSTAKTSSYSVDMKSARDGRQVYCVITDKYGNSVKSNVVTLTMKKPAKITKQPVSVSVSKGKTAKVSVTATGDGLKYKWYFKDKDSSKFSASSTFKGSTYTADMTASRNGRQVYCVITDKYGNKVQTKTVTLKIK